MKSSKELLDIDNRRNKISLILAAILDIEKDQTYSAGELNIDEIVKCVTGASNFTHYVLAKFPKMTRNNLKLSSTEVYNLIECLAESECTVNELEEIKLSKNMHRLQVLTDWYQGKILHAKHGATPESRILNTIFERKAYFIKNLNERFIACSTANSPTILILWFKSEGIVKKPTVSSAETAVNATASLPLAHK